MIDLLPIFASLNSELISLVQTFKTSDWEKKTVNEQWNVKEIVTHLLDANLKILATNRDGYVNLKNTNFSANEEFVIDKKQIDNNFINALYKVSPRILIEITAKYQDELLTYFKTLNPTDKSLLPMNGDNAESPENWLNIAKAYSERWLHQQQIRFAFNNQKLLDRAYYYPYLNTVMQGLPFAYLKVNATNGALVKVEIVGPAGGTWSIIKNQNNWSLVKNDANNPDALVYIDQQIAWLLFSNGINPMDAVQYYQLHGDTALGSHALKMVTVIG